MPVVLSKEKSKYGSGTGSIIIWPVEITDTNPNASSNVALLPAGYLKCDGTVYKAEDYPQLAEILGVGTASKFIRYDINNDPIDNVDDDEFIVPDLGSKYPKPTTGSAAGTYINIVLEDQAGNEKRRSGMGIEASATVGTTTGNTTVIPVSYTGTFNVPSQDISLKGKPSWSKGTNNTGFTDDEAVDPLAIHSHMHFSSTNRLRIKTTNEDTEPKSNGIGSYQTASTIPLSDWLDNTKYGGNQAAGTNQPPCWAIGSGAASPSQLVESTTILGSIAEVIYYNYCHDLRGNAGLSAMRYQCLLASQTSFNLRNIDFFAAPAYKSFAVCIPSGSGDANPYIGAVPATYTTGAQGVPNDWNGTSLSDVVPLNSNTSTKTAQSYPQVNNIFTEIDENTVADGDPSIHSHKILLTQGTHSYKIRTKGFLLSPDNLKTVLTLQTDQIASLDQVTSPYIIMEYLIKY